MAKTTIEVRTETRDRLRDLGKKEQTYDDLLVKILDRLEECNNKN